MQPDKPTNDPGKTPGAAETGGGSLQSDRQYPGKTPGSAEGDRKTIEEDLRQKSSASPPKTP